VESDTEEVWNHMQKIVGEFAQQDPESTLALQGLESLSRDHAAEVVRYGGSELHAVSAFIGGQ
jgi:hypothetical protein